MKIAQMHPSPSWNFFCFFQIEQTARSKPGTFSQTNPVWVKTFVRFAEMLDMNITYEHVRCNYQKYCYAYRVTARAT